MNDVQQPRRAAESPNRDTSVCAVEGSLDQEPDERNADCKSAIQQSATLRYKASVFDVSRISAVLAWIKNFFDYLGGSREEPPPGAAFLASPIWVGIWWGLLIGLVLLFCGQTSKFIYIDF